MNLTFEQFIEVMLDARKIGSWDNVLIIPQDGGSPYRLSTSVRYQYMTGTFKGDRCEIAVYYVKQNEFQAVYEELADSEYVDHYGIPRFNRTD